eukprot:CAMPEP_0206238526 /NCGR_PEP_ID=MMETSP0047_2-20121206/14867_1 /ASSEMBLY_ACC=CAM_ASM_000192 /TAXON_ID=195065 /ORGANISM="Chroomonas mesostigmatica_cf, Strain CCMP1168" /LENGTH=50 /DNA_ID=CAMNT_0053663077 /DNA_START=49 /DNA_END=198 /DNA_ORIENTATION=+
MKHPRHHNGNVAALPNGSNGTNDAELRRGSVMSLPLGGVRNRSDGGSTAA